MGTSPSCLALNQPGTRLYSANETDRVGEQKEGSVSAFAINRADGKLALLNTVRSGGAGPTHVSIHPSGRFLLVANYFGGSVAVLPILPDGRLGAPTDIQNDAGKLGPTRAANAPPGSFAISGHDRTHAHMIQADPAGRFVLHVDLGLDTIFVWKFDEQKGVLTPNAPPTVALPPGDGPRHFHFHPNGRWCYSIQEEGSTIVVFDYDAAKGRLASRQTISTLPAGFAGSNFCSEILVSADGRFVYAGNRLHDSIGIFSVASNGTLTWVGEEWTHGMDPRQLSAQLQLRPGRSVPLLLQSTRGQRRRLPRGAWNGRPHVHRPLHGRRQPVEHRFPRSGNGGLKTPALPAGRFGPHAPAAGSAPGPGRHGRYSRSKLAFMSASLNRTGLNCPRANRPA
jgi:6-phosphogluconolactonase (cycloisomerase 2 family)